MRRTAHGLLVAGLLSACATTAPAPDAPSHLEVVSGHQQLGTPGYVLADSLVVRLVTAAGAPVAGARVAWQAVDRDAVVSAGATATDADGIVRAAWRLGRDDGPQHAVATFANLPAATFEALAWSGDVLQAGGSPERQCGIFRDEVARCWEAPNATPATVVALDTDQRFFSLGYAIDRWCGSTRAGTIACFLEADLMPGGVFRPEAAPLHLVAAGVPPLTRIVGAGDPERGATWCGVALDQAVWCWGRNAAGQLGRGSSGADGGPAPVGAGFRGTAIAVTREAVCALDTVGAAWCWGDAADQVVPGGAPSPLPVAVPTVLRFVAIAADATGSVCAIAAGAGVVHCWGSNHGGGRGRSGQVASSEPVAIEGTDVFVALTADSDGFLGLTIDRFLVVWGGLVGAAADARPLRVLPGHVFGELFGGGGRGAVCLRAYPSGTRCVDRSGLARALTTAPTLPVLYGIPSGGP